MIHYSDIHDALARGDIPEIEDAFRAFVGFPNEDTIEGIVTIDDMVETFVKICTALRTDRRILPDGVFTDLVDVGLSRDRMIENRTYGAGARLALDCMPQFRAIFERHLEPGDVLSLVDLGAAVGARPVGEV